MRGVDIPGLDLPHAVHRTPLRTQLITLAVGNLRSSDDTAAVRWVLSRIGGVDVVDADQEAVRVWVFGDGTVEPLTLVDELGSCGFGAIVLEHQVQILH
jgi:hypothetical protein